MYSLYVDIAFAVLAIIMVFQGYRNGFVRMAGSLVALAVSATAATAGITWLESFTGWHVTTNPIVFVIVFLVLTLILTKIIGIGITILDLVRKIFSIIPGVGLINSLLGAVIGLAQALLVAAALAFAAVNFFPNGVVRTTLLESEVISNVVDIMAGQGII